MVIGLSLGLLGLLGVAFGASKLANSEVIGGALPSLSTPSSKTISENDAKLASEYQSNAILDSSTSPQPYISSNEYSRPQGVSGGNNNNDLNGRKSRIATILGLGSASAVGYALGSDEESTKHFKWGAILGLALGGYVVYKVFK